MTNYCVLVALAMIIVEKILVEGGLVKSWLPSFEWESKSNWFDDRVPKSNDRVIFPKRMGHAVGLPIVSNLSLTGIELPWEGSVVLSRDGTLRLTTITDRRREYVNEKQTARWSREGPLFWADPNNWNFSSEAVPHVERVPCRQDDVLLPPANHTLSIVLPTSTDVQIRSVRTVDDAGVPFLKYQWDLMKTRREFYSKSSNDVRYSLYACENCECQANPVDYVQEVCAIERPRCGPIVCEYPFKVYGHCCDFCGARIELSNRVSLPMTKALVDETLLAGGYRPHLSWYIRRLPDRRTQILIREKYSYTGSKCYEAVEYLKKILQEEGLQILYTETSGLASTNFRLTKALGQAIGVLFIVLLCLLSTCFYFGYSFQELVSSCRQVCSIVHGEMMEGRDPSSRRLKSFDFARFENVQDNGEGNVEMLDAAPGDRERSKANRNDQSDDEDRAESFENPLYRSKRNKEKAVFFSNFNTPAMSLVQLGNDENDRGS